MSRQFRKQLRSLRLSEQAAAKAQQRQWKQTYQERAREALRRAMRKRRQRALQGELVAILDAVNRHYLNSRGSRPPLGCSHEDAELQWDVSRDGLSFHAKRISLELTEADIISVVLGKPSEPQYLLPTEPGWRDKLENLLLSALADPTCPCAYSWEVEPAL